ncbi:MAG: 1-deoxy-D-xylulose-5-phosphate synthase [Spirochaetes bacterium]|nr:1-deoxy-D-xylulose-5-phosphate synthase [Spirochaetota bacterium]
MERQGRILPTLRDPMDLRSLPSEAFPRLAEEIRSEIIRVVSKNGGHLASNLGIVELTLALHAEFESPKDVIIWDVGHQCYPHKLLTGRYTAFETLRKKGGISGFPKRSESPHDAVETGHASTSISEALGIRVGRDLQKLPGKVIAVIGDGALSGGIALEGLNHAGHLGKDLIVILNDNKMSISENVGALSSYLSRITGTKLYQDIRDRIDQTVKRVPKYGSQLMDLIDRAKKGVKAAILQENLFSDLGFEYIGPLDGHNVALLREVFRNIKTLSKPIVVHVFTQKGKGYVHAENNPSKFHGVAPFSIEDGIVEKSPSISFTERFSQSLVRLAEQDKRIVAITAAMAKGTGLSLFQERFPDRFFDVGITEQHAVTFAAGLAHAGMRPVVAIYATFMQRAVDQVIHDIALPKLPVVLALDRSGFVGEDGETHQGLYDVALFRSVPNLTILSPASGVELDRMLEYALLQDHPVLIRYPKAECGQDYAGLGDPLVPGRGVFVQQRGASILILSVGGLLPQAVEASSLLTQQGIDTDLYNLRFLKPLDEEHFKYLIAPYKAILLVEEATRQGGMGERIGTLLHEWKGVYKHLGSPDSFIPHASREELLEQYGLDGKGIASAVLSLVEEGHLFHRRILSVRRSMAR